MMTSSKLVCGQMFWRILTICHNFILVLLWRCFHGYHGNSIQYAIDFASKSSFYVFPGTGQCSEKECKESIVKLRTGP